MPPGSYQPTVVWRSSIAVKGRCSSVLSLASHTGTHVDAPRHFFEDGLSIDKIPLDRLVGKATLIDVSDCLLADRVIPLEALQHSVSLPSKDSIAIIRTGAGKYYGTTGFYTSFPVLAETATRWLINRGIKGFGIDTIAVDSLELNGRLMVNHRLLLSHNIPIVECLANLDLLEKRDFEFFALPLRVCGVDGASCRAIAILEE